MRASSAILETRNGEKETLTPWKKKKWIWNRWSQVQRSQQEKRQFELISEDKTKNFPCHTACLAQSLYLDMTINLTHKLTSSHNIKSSTDRHHEE